MCESLRFHNPPYPSSDNSAHLDHLAHMQKLTKVLMLQRQRCLGMRMVESLPIGGAPHLEAPLVAQCRPKCSQKNPWGFSQGTRNDPKYHQSVPKTCPGVPRGTLNESCIISNLARGPKRVGVMGEAIELAGPLQGSKAWCKHYSFGFISLKISKRFRGPSPLPPTSSQVQPKLVKYKPKTMTERLPMDP